MPIRSIESPMLTRRIIARTAEGEVHCMGKRRKKLLTHAARSAGSGWGTARSLLDHVVEDQEDRGILDHGHHGSGCIAVTDENRETGPANDTGERSNDAHLANAAELADGEEHATDDHESWNEVCENPGDHSECRDCRKHTLGHADETCNITVVVHAVADEHETEGNTWQTFDDAL
jgi:hypothetical protein